uniref:Uncharacterized protein n=1 Tax=Panagrolaimus sp. JU765 TaxID=591449 RepID=A0AC34RRS8_9BILA
MFLEFGKEYLFETNQNNEEKVICRAWLTGIGEKPDEFIFWEQNDASYLYTIRENNAIYRSDLDGSSEIRFKAFYYKGTGFETFKSFNYADERREYSCVDHECHEIDSDFKDQINSINTSGGCVALFEDENCKGRRVIFKPGCDHGECCESHANFSSCNFTNDTVSYACC